MSLYKLSKIFVTMTAAWIFCAVNGAYAGDAQPDSRSSFKFRGQPGDRCANFLISEVGVHYGDKSGEHIMADLGLMHNDRANNALGLSLCAYIEDTQDRGSNGLGFRPRYKRWLGKSWSMDFSLGVVFIEDDRGSILLSTLSLSFSEIVSLDIFLEKRSGEYPKTEWFFGATLRSYAGMAAMVGTYVLIALRG